LPAEPAAVLDEVVLTPTSKAVPGLKPATIVRYLNPAATNLLIAGSWDGWQTKRALESDGGFWLFDIRKLRLTAGRYEFKFLPNGRWEPGGNRVLFVDDDGYLRRSADVILCARQETHTRIDVLFKRAMDTAAPLHVRLIPPVEIESWHWRQGDGESRRWGYAVAAGHVTFVLDEDRYRVALKPSDRVAVAGNFNGWDGSGGPHGEWLLHRVPDQRIWELTLPLGALRPVNENEILFKFVVNGHHWLPPQADAPNTVTDPHGNVNLCLNPARSSGLILEVHTRQPLALSNAYLLAVQGPFEGTAIASVTPGAILDTYVSTKPLGVELDQEGARTIFRLFAPRASGVTLCLSASPEFTAAAPQDDSSQSLKMIPMQFDPGDGVWEAVLAGLHVGCYYSFHVDGPPGAGESFNPQPPVGDPYALAAAHAHNRTIILDPHVTNVWFAGWSHNNYTTPAWEDMVIYETHVRDFTIHPSCGLPEHFRGKYAGVTATLGTGLGLDHLRSLGVNMIEFMPLAEFENGTNDYSWGYAPVYYFAPEASYGLTPLQGSQYYKFKQLVDTLHRNGFGVILDVVYNHVGSPNVFALIDKKYYFRLSPDFEYSNFSGCGNDVRSEAPMMRRLIVDNVLYWMREFHVDGFRFDLAELIDLPTLMAVRDAAKALNPNVILISEPWSSRGDHKTALKGTGWSAWNNEFRDTVREFVLGRGRRDQLCRVIVGSVDLWTAHPLQSVNYLESHDDMCLADQLSEASGNNGSRLTERAAARNRLAATFLATSLGIPMIAEGQEFLRSKGGRHNTFDQGDAVNALRWDDRKRPLAELNWRYYAGLIALRQSAEGAAFRLREPLPAGYYQWIEPVDGRALGYIVNAGHLRPGSTFVILVNAAEQAVDFCVPFPTGIWRLVADGRRINPAGLSENVALDDKNRLRTIGVPALCAYILADKQQ